MHKREHSGQRCWKYLIWTNKKRRNFKKPLLNNQTDSHALLKAIPSSELPPELSVEPLPPEAGASSSADSGNEGQKTLAANACCR